MKKELLQKSLIKLNEVCDILEKTKDVNSNSDLQELSLKLKAKQQVLHESVSEKPLLMSKIRIGQTEPRGHKAWILIKDHLSKQQYAAETLTNKLEKDLNDGKQFSNLKRIT